MDDLNTEVTKRPETCDHKDAFWMDDDLYCPDCETAIGITCQTCGGQGFVSEADYECDWINYSDDEIITCPVCDGDGVDYS